MCADDDWDSDPEIEPLCTTDDDLLSYLEVEVPANAAYAVLVSSYNEVTACKEGFAVPTTPYAVTLSETCISQACARKRAPGVSGTSPAPTLKGPAEKLTREQRRELKQKKKCGRGKKGAQKAV